jgi:hypothetical protein
MKLKKTIKDAIAMIGLIIIAVACAIGFITVFIHGMDKQEVVNCNKLVEQSKQFDGFFITKSDDEMCRHHGIVIDAPIGFANHSEIVE